MKAILVIEMPSDMRIEETKALYMTLFNGMIAREYTLDCPLRPLPEKHENKDKHEYEIGWNDCIEEIENGTYR